jgi:HSP20 family molecular chaperone IbpA
LSWDPFKIIEDVIRNMRKRMRETERMMDELLRNLLGSEELYESSYERALSTLRSGKTEPLASIYEEGDYVIIAVSVPGAKRESISVKVYEDRVEIEASLDVSKVSKAWGYSYRYTSLKEYRGVYPLKEKVDPSTASYEIKGDIVLIRVKKKYH